MMMAKDFLISGHTGLGMHLRKNDTEKNSIALWREHPDDRC
jgi:hypothetical protein